MFSYTVVFFVALSTHEIPAQGTISLDVFIYTSFKRQSSQYKA